jgi:hypothetical protein
VVAPFREGKLCISSGVELARVITPENSEDVLPRFFYLSKQEAKAVEVEICPAAVVPRREVVTKVVAELPRAATFQLDETPSTPFVQAVPQAVPIQLEPLTPNLQRLHTDRVEAVPLQARSRAKGSGTRPARSLGREDPRGPARPAAGPAGEAARGSEEASAAPPPGEEPRPGHRRGEARRVVARRGESARGRSIPEASAARPRASRSTTSSPRGRGGPSTVENCRLACAMHNRLAARQVYGEEWMDRFTKGARMGLLRSPGSE